MSSKLFGLGLDAQYSACYPQKMSGLCNRYREKLSHLSIVGLGSTGAARHFREDISQELPVIHHLHGVSPADPDGPHITRFLELDKVSSELDCIWCCEDIGIWSIGPYEIPYFAPPPFDKDVADLVASRINLLLELSSKPFLAEVPSCSFVVGQLTLGEFFYRIVDQSSCNLVLDVSHVFSYATALQLDPVDVLHSLPLERVIEAHIAGGRIHNLYKHRYVDTHSDPILGDILMLLSIAASECENLQCVTYEIGANLSGQQIDCDILRIEKSLKESSFLPFSHDAQVREQ